MKTILKSALLATVLSGTTLMAGTILDLSAQHFSNSLDGDGEGARYDLPKVYVSTALKYTNGTYTLTSSTQQPMVVEIKSPPLNWSVSFSVSYYLNGKVNPIRFTSDTGKIVTLSFKYKEIFLNGVRIHQSDSLVYRTTISGSITKSGNIVRCQIAGFPTKTITVNNFSKLKFVNILLINGYTGDYYDKGLAYLSGLNISSN